jgi:carboxymethylenebutenolidase
MAITGEDIKDGARQAYLARPAGRTDAGVLLLPSVHGADRHAKDYAHRLAEVGLATLIWEPFPGHPPALNREGRQARLKTLDDASSLREMTFWLDHLHGALGARRTGTVGFCLGGRYALLLAARDPRLTACVPFYPTIETPPLEGQDQDVVALAAVIPCPAHMVTAGSDHITTRETFARLQQSLQRRSVPTVIEFYPEGEHGFMQTDMRPGKANATAVRFALAQTVPFLQTALATDGVAK